MSQNNRPNFNNQQQVQFMNNPSTMINMNSIPQNAQNMQQHQSYNWGGVMGFLQEQLSNSHAREQEWQVERKQLIEKIEIMENQIQLKDQELIHLREKMKLFEMNIGSQDRTQPNNIKPQGTQKQKKSQYPGHSRVKSDFVTNLFNQHGDKIIATTQNSITSSIIYSGGGAGDQKKFNRLLNQAGLNPVYPNQNNPNQTPEKTKQPYHRHCHSYGGQTNTFQSHHNTLNNSSQFNNTFHNNSQSGGGGGGNSSIPQYMNIDFNSSSNKKARSLKQSQQFEGNNSLLIGGPSNSNTTNSNPNNNSNNSSNINNNTPVNPNIHLSPPPPKTRIEQFDEKGGGYEDLYNNTFNPANNSMIFNPLNNSSLLGGNPVSGGIVGSNKSNINNTSFNNNNSYLGSPSFIGNSSNNNSFTNNLNNSNHAAANFNMQNLSQSKVQQNNFMDSLQQGQQSLIQEDDNDHSSNSLDQFKRISTKLSSQKPTINSNLTPLQKFNITFKRRWTNEKATNPNEVVYSPYDAKSSLPNASSSNGNKSSGLYNISKSGHRNLIKDLANDIDQSHQLGKKLLQPKCTLRSHFDGVRSLFFTALEPILATVSEDCMVKLWDVRKFQNASDSTHIEPYYTMRYHAGPLFTITGNQQGESINPYNLLYTAGSEGTIRVWSPPHPDNVNSFGPCGSKNYCISVWNAHSDVIWDLNHHPKENLLLSSSADGSIKIWQTMQEDENESIKPNNGTYLWNLCYKNSKYNSLDTPTSVTWTYNQQDSIVSGYVNSNHLVVFDRESAKIISSPTFLSDDIYSPDCQVNKICWDHHLGILASGHEDQSIKFFDIKSGSMINSLIGHTDAVTSLSFSNKQYQLASVGHDGSIRTWDTRQFKCIHEIPAHKKKFDEGIHAVTHHKSMPYLATGGADGHIKIFSQFE